MQPRSDNVTGGTEACVPMASLPAGRSRYQRLVLVLPFLLSCTAAPTLDEQQERIDSFVAQGGYRGSRNLDVVSLRETWLHDRDRLDVSLLLPQRAGRSPLILYMAGLGEDAEAGYFWRQAWAQGGYAVVSVQPVAVSRALDFSGRLRSGDLREVGRRFFSPTFREQRVAHVVWAFAELCRRSRSQMSLLSAVDLNRVALAGFDLGAQTVMWLASEADSTADKRPDSLSPRAAIVLSPYYPITDDGFANRRLKVHIPLLSVTGREDEDPYGITPVPVRTFLWKELPHGEKFQLLLRRGRYATLAGSAAGWDPSDQRRFDPSGRAPGDESGSRAAGSAPAPGQSGGPGDRAPDVGGGHVRRPDYREVAIVRSISLAFLDFAVKGRSDALSWLQQDAAFWIGRSGTLMHR